MSDDETPGDSNFAPPGDETRSSLRANRQNRLSELQKARIDQGAIDAVDQNNEDRPRRLRNKSDSRSERRPLSSLRSRRLARSGADEQGDNEKNGEIQGENIDANLSSNSSSNDSANVSTTPSMEQNVTLQNVVLFKPLPPMEDLEIVPIKNHAEEGVSSLTQINQGISEMLNSFKEAQKARDDHVQKVLDTYQQQRLAIVERNKIILEKKKKRALLLQKRRRQQQLQQQLQQEQEQQEKLEKQRLEEKKRKEKLQRERKVKLAKLTKLGELAKLAKESKRGRIAKRKRIQERNAQIRLRNEKLKKIEELEHHKFESYSQTEDKVEIEPVQQDPEEFIRKIIVSEEFIEYEEEEEEEFEEEEEEEEYYEDENVIIESESTQEKSAQENIEQNKENAEDLQKSNSSLETESSKKTVIENEKITNIEISGGGPDLVEDNWTRLVLYIVFALWAIALIYRIFIN